MKDLTFRDAIYNDLERIVEIYNTTITSRMVTADTEQVIVESRQKWFHEHSPSKRPWWVVQDDDDQTTVWVSFQSFYGPQAYDATVKISLYLDTNVWRRNSESKHYSPSFLHIMSPV